LSLESQQRPSLYQKQATRSAGVLRRSVSNSRARMGVEPQLRCRVPAARGAAGVAAGDNDGNDLPPGSPLTPWGSMFAIWGRDERDEPEVGGRPDVVIHAVMTFADGAPSYEALLELVNSKLLCHKRFRRRIQVEERGDPLWIPCQVDAAEHIRSLRMAGPTGGSDQLGADTELMAHVQRDLSAPMPAGRPPWEVQRIEYTDAAGGALHWKIHHAIGDGISLASLLLGFVDGGMPEMPGDSARSTAAPVPRSLLARLAHTGARAAAFAYNTAVALSRATYLLFVPDLPSAVRAQGVLYRKWAKRRIALSPEMPLAEVKAIGRSLGAATVNDVVMTAVAGGLARYEKRHGCPPCGKRLTGSMVVNIRPMKGIQADIARSEAGEDAHWGNRIGPIFCPMAVFNPDGSDIDPRSRLLKMHSFLAPKKVSLEPLILAWVINTAGKLIGTDMSYWLTNRLGMATSIVVSNVPGPQEPISIGGKAVTDLFNTANGSPLGATFSFLSYNGSIRLALITPCAVVPEPAELVQDVMDSLTELREALL